MRSEALIWDKFNGRVLCFWRLKMVNVNWQTEKMSLAMGQMIDVEPSLEKKQKQV